MKLAEYLKGMPEPQRVELARQAGTTWLHLRNVAFSGKACGIPLAVGIEQATAGATQLQQRAEAARAELAQVQAKLAETQAQVAELQQPRQ